MKHIHTYSQDAEQMIKGMRSFRALVRHAKNDGNIVIIKCGQISFSKI